MTPTKRRARPKAVWIVVDKYGHTRPARAHDRRGALDEADTALARGMSPGLPFRVVRYVPSDGSAEGKLKVAILTLRNIRAMPHDACCDEMPGNCRGCVANRALDRLDEMKRKP